MTKQEKCLKHWSQRVNLLMKSVQILINPYDRRKKMQMATKQEETVSFVLQWGKQESW